MQRKVSQILSLIPVLASRSLEVKTDKLFDLHVKCYLPACFVSMRPWALCGVWVSAQVLSPGALFRDGLGKWGFCSLEQSQGHLLLAGVRTTCGTVNTKKSLSKGFSVALHLWHSHPHFIEFLKLPHLGSGLCLWMDFSDYYTPGITGCSNNKKSSSQGWEMERHIIIRNKIAAWKLSYL